MIRIEKKRLTREKGCQIFLAKAARERLKDEIAGKHCGNFTSKTVSCDVLRRSMEHSEIAPACPKAEVSENLAVKPHQDKQATIRKESASELVRAIKSLLKSTSALFKPKARFDVSMEAAEHNFALLKKEKFDLRSVVEDVAKPSADSVGSEFKSVESLADLFRKHPRWNCLKRTLLHGSEWQVEHLDDKTRLEDLKNAIERGNHKSATKEKEFLSEGSSKEAQKGWQLLLPLNKALEIPGLTMLPMGVVPRLGISASGEFAPKKRIAHDLSFPGFHSDESTNSRAIEELQEPRALGYALLRVIHKIVQLRSKFPNKIIWIRKEDVKSAYRRTHLRPRSSMLAGVQTEMQKEKLLLISLRLPFGGAPCSSEF